MVTLTPTGDPVSISRIWGKKRGAPPQTAVCSFAARGPKEKHFAIRELPAKYGEADATAKGGGKSRSFCPVPSNPILQRLSAHVRQAADLFC